MKAWRRSSSSRPSSPPAVLLTLITDDGGGDYRFTFSANISSGPTDATKFHIVTDAGAFNGTSLDVSAGNETTVIFATASGTLISGSITAGHGLTFTGGGVLAVPATWP